MKQYLIIFLSAFTLSLHLSNQSFGQVCASPSTTIYGITSSGVIYPINVSNAAVGAAVNTAYGSPSSSNALGYSGVNGNFYFFNVNYSSQQFVSFNPVLNTTTVLANCPLTASVRSGCVNNDGTGYYCLDQNANLFYYNIGLNTWTNITNKWFDQTSTNITNTVVKPQSSGDMAFDGNGNLWLLLSSGSAYGLYEIIAGLPTTPVGSITANQIMAPTTPTPDGSTIAGIAFSTTGQFYLSTINDHLYILNNNLTTTLLGTFTTAGVGIDLTSCSFPTSVLPVNFVSFDIDGTSNNQINLNWTVVQKANTEIYQIEESQDGAKWQSIGSLSSNTIQGMQSYAYTITNSSANTIFYRICEIDKDGRKFYSQTRTIKTSSANSISFSPNPATSSLKIKNASNGTLKAKIFDPLGRCVKEILVQPGINNTDISFLPKNSYMLVLEGQQSNTSWKFIKQ
ncbi:MAG: hypothetical protein NVS1B13_11710 [Flavisolibacter sp.]